MAPSSFCRFLLHHNFFEKLRMSFFGYFVDDKAAIKALHFCRYLIQLAVSTNDVRLERLIVDDLLPCLIWRLDNELQCATQSLRHESGSSTDGSVDKELHALCEDLYVYLVKDSDGEDKESRRAENNYTSWLENEMENLRVKAGSAAKELLEGSDWNWEFEDEFQRYLPAYMEMLEQVDSMDVSDERDYLKEEALLQKLRPEFRSKYGINSCEHPYMLTISSLRQQQFYSMNGLIYQREKTKFLSKLIILKPYIKVSDCSSDIIRRLRDKSEIQYELPEWALLPSVDFLHTVLLLWEPVYHPLIRQSHMATLLWIVDHYNKGSNREYVQQVVPATHDFKLHLQPYAYAFFETKLKDNKQKGHLKVLITELETEGFFDTDNASIDWEKERFSELGNQFCGKVFAGHSLPKHFVIRGIMDYRSILSLKDRSQPDAFRFVVGRVCDRWIERCEAVLTSIHLQLYRCLNSHKMSGGKWKSIVKCIIKKHSCHYLFIYLVFVLYVSPVLDGDTIP
ncbi:uncharacterized protein [Triticum aestivum]|uniref:uncharacterized protein isoform X1 n=1 Tax=Triticum aestivum TaxID=4565 RepID=UPI001D02DC58|nr:uncharacterized protein LOC123144215 isoform X1 [Triticum aestivum]XP_044419209.1 uncharacterized protein LOC123144215 isoform X1 [Triticum aestivum]XP_044419210.1 uncharacterized protein LOC123144215 isoform X1 [Triticum aestivum]XP_044419211.1 uncharacterized protein LOC123144215 isoform X1 [Triticum aestivum]XP_044419212.1 uncharacterized protein LOC123144215 isoform X1 [Triticum aestivum]XP_044419213.1 uncharacterized protein LOC123144215 isoform X1 [Triticum aestivum]